MDATSLLAVVAGGLLVFLVGGALVTDRKLKRLERGIAADEAAREAAGRPAE